jgi:hypothetical protein
MADDVKVKFGGDFTDVSKGATEATSKAGGALSSWFNDFNKSTVASITSALALAAVFGKFTEQMANTLKSAKGIDEAFKRFGTGKNSQEFQLLARYGAEVGVSMEAVGRTMNYFAKVNDSAAKGSEQHRSVLRALKFTEDEVTSGKVSAIEVLRRMSDEYDKTGNEALSAQRAVQLFGLQGEQLSAIYKNGKINLDEFSKSVVLMTDKTIENLARIERRKESFKRTMEGIFGGVLEEIGRESSSVLGAGVTMEAMAVVGETGGTSEQEGRSIGGQIYSELKGDEDAIAEDIKQLQDYEEDDWFTSQAQYEAAAEAIKTIKLLRDNERKAAEEKPGKEGPPLLQAARVMAVSSLQDIGGGDVGSVLSGTYQTSMLDAANKTAENTAKLAAETGKPPVSKPTNVAK